MPKPFSELRERLLRVGVAPRHARRYLAELADHMADLTAEEERAGHSRTDAESAALVRLGGLDGLVRAMTQQRHFQSWCARAPWAMFGLAPLFLMAGAWLVALLILCSGWKIFLPDANTPFTPVDGFAAYYFGVGRLLYYSAPVLVGWGTALVAVRQRLKSVWPAIGMGLLASVASTAQVRASRTAVPGGLAHVSMKFALAPSAQAIAAVLLHTLATLSLALLPYLIWRIGASLHRQGDNVT